jgi:hypothetical protein
MKFSGSKITISQMVLRKTRDVKYIVYDEIYIEVEEEDDDDDNNNNSEIGNDEQEEFDDNEGLNCFDGFFFFFIFKLP